MEPAKVAIAPCRGRLARPPRALALLMVIAGPQAAAWMSTSGCARAREGEVDRPPPSPTRGRPAHAVTAAEMAAAPAAMRQYADMAAAVYADAAAGAARLLEAIDRLRAAPSAASLAGARRAWLVARRAYLQSEVLRFYDGPIDRVEMLINTWPIDESYVEDERDADGAQGSAAPGIIDDVIGHPEITASVIVSLNAREGETSISTGYHVIEFLLWGRDRRADGPGDRPFSDYVTRTGAARGRSATLARRRGAYLQVATELLLGQLRALAGEWAPRGAGAVDNYRAAFLRLPPREALGRMIKGMGALGGPELAGERLTVAYETKDQENEHSCFSDNTHEDIALDARGIENACLGRYQRENGPGGAADVVRGPGVCDWVALADAHLGERLRADIAAGAAAARAIPAPFDQAILGQDSSPGRQAIRRTIQALERQSETLAEAAALFDIALTPTSLPRARGARVSPSPPLSALPGRP